MGEMENPIENTIYMCVNVIYVYTYFHQAEDVFINFYS